MSDLLNSLNAPSEAPPKSWEQEVADAGAEAPASVPEPAPAPVAEPVQEAAPEPPQAQETASEETDRRVPLKALQEERQKRSEAERRAAENERRITEMMARMEQIQQQLAPQTPEPTPPDPETDPIGALKFQNERLQKLQEEARQQAYEQQLNVVAYRAAVEFKAQAPDYPDAYQYAIKSRAAELSAIGTPDHAIPDILRREEMNLIATAHQNGRNPAQAIYEFAKARGYQMPQPAPAPLAAAPAPVAPQPAPNPQLQQAKAAVAASAAAGGAPAAKGELTIAEISNLKGAAFDAAWNKMFKSNGSSIFRE